MQKRKTTTKKQQQQQQALALVPAVPPLSRRHGHPTAMEEISVVLTAAQALLARLRARGWRDLEQRVRVGKRECALVAARCALGYPPAA